MKEPEVTNIRSRAHERLEVRETEQPMLDNRDMCGAMCVVCAALITYLMCEKGKIVYVGGIQFYGSIISSILLITLILFWITQKIVMFCFKRAKRKADIRVD